MEALASSSSQIEAPLSIAHLRLQGLRKFSSWRSSAKVHASGRVRIRLAPLHQSPTRFSPAYPPSFERCGSCLALGPENDNGETSSEKEDSDKAPDTTPPAPDTTPPVWNEDFPSTGSKDAGEDDWRAFRAKLVVGEQAESNPSSHQGPENIPKSLNKKWAHPIPFPETGCLLIATDKLDGQAPFERSVILLLRLGSAKPQDGPFGVILNRPILHMAKESPLMADRMVQMLRKCKLFYGGPLPADIFLLTQLADGFKNLEEIMPGIHYGYAHGLQQVTDLTVQDKILNDFRFYVGYAGWDYNQLKDEIAHGFWWVAACSPDLIKEAQTDELWQEVLTSMGGKYAEIGRKSQGEML